MNDNIKKIFKLGEKLKSLRKDREKYERDTTEYKNLTSQIKNDKKKKNM